MMNSSIYYRSISLLMLALPAFVHAEEACEPLSQIHERTNFCSENPNYIPPAKECRDRFRELVKNKNAEIQRLLAGQVSTGKDKAQNLKFVTTQTVYTTTEKILSELILRGNQVLFEVGAYGDDFVPPIPSWAKGHFKPNRRNPNDPARKPDFYCYAEPIKDIDQILAEVQKMVSELEATRMRTTQLHQGTTDRKVKLADLGEEGGGSTSTRVAGKHDHEASTVTGEIKNASLPDPAAAGKSSNQIDSMEKLPRFSGEPTKSKRSARNSHSTITEESRALFSGSLSQPQVSSLNKNSNRNAYPEAAPSSGEVLWQEPKKDSNQINLEMKQALAGASDSVPNDLENASRSLASSDFSESGIGIRTSPSKGLQANLALVAEDTTLFAAVSRYYRSSELFHRPR